MKRLILSVSVAVVAALSLYAADHRNNHFTLGAAYLSTTHTVGDANFGFPQYQGAELRGSYKFYVKKGLYVAPELNVFYENHKVSQPLYVGTIGPDYVPSATIDRGCHAYGFGLGLRPVVGYTINVYESSSWDFYTAPSMRWTVDQHQHLVDDYFGFDIDGVKTRRVSFFWTFGAAFRLGCISVFGEYNLRLSRIARIVGPTSMTGGTFGFDTFSVGIAYNF